MKNRKYEAMQIDTNQRTYESNYRFSIWWMIWIKVYNIQFKITRTTNNKIVNFNESNHDTIHMAW